MYPDVIMHLQIFDSTNHNALAVLSQTSLSHQTKLPAILGIFKMFSSLMIQQTRVNFEIAPSFLSSLSVGFHFLLGNAILCPGAYSLSLQCYLSVCLSVRLQTLGPTFFSVDSVISLFKSFLPFTRSL